MSALTNVQKYFPEVGRVVDAKQPITVEVTSADTKKATVKNHKSCALAVACRRKEDADGIIVSLDTCYVIKGGVATRYRMKETTTREVVSFDREAGFAPGNYELIPQCPSRRLGAIHGSQVRAAKPEKKKAAKHFTSGVRTVLGSKETGGRAR